MAMPIGGNVKFQVGQGGDVFERFNQRDIAQHDGDSSILRADTGCSRSAGTLNRGVGVRLRLDGMKADCNRARPLAGPQALGALFEVIQRFLEAGFVKFQLGNHNVLKQL